MTILGSGRFARVALAAVAALAAAIVPVTAEQTIVVTNRVIYPGQAITADALDEVPLRRVLRDPAAVLHVPDQLAGKVARRTLLPGRLIAPGAPVQLVYVHGPLTIQATGMPLQTGIAGERIRLRNVDSGIVVTGTVMDDGTVRIPES
jgi:flagellar basal body P-ring formation protein FlgA